MLPVFMLGATDENDPPDESSVFNIMYMFINTQQETGGLSTPSGECVLTPGEGVQVSRVLFASEGTMEREVGRRIGAVLQSQAQRCPVFSAPL